jgi:hypothetical protein
MRIPDLIGFTACIPAADAVISAAVLMLTHLLCCYHPSFCAAGILNAMLLVFQLFC